MMKFASGKKLGFNRDAPIALPDNSSHLPLTSVYPIVQISLFTLGTIYAIQYYRYVVFPLFLAGVFYHYEQTGIKELDERVSPVINEYESFSSTYSLFSTRKNWNI